MNGWISVKYRLPEERSKYIVYSESGTISTAYFTGHYFETDDPGIGDALYWMCLPEPPVTK